MFYGCTRLNEIIFNTRISTIHDMAFAYSGLVKITIPESVRTIGMHIFANCTSLKAVAYCVSVIDQCSETAFANSVGNISVPATYLKPDLCGITAMIDETVCIEEAVHHGDNGIVEIFEQDHELLHFETASHIITRGLDHINVKEMIIGPDTRVVVTGKVMIGSSLIMENGARLISNTGLSMGNNNTKIVLSANSRHVPVANLGKVKTKNVPSEILVEIDNGDMDRDSVALLKEGTTIITGSGENFNCEEWKSKVKVSLKRPTKYTWSSECVFTDGIYEIVISGDESTVMTIIIALLFVILAAVITVTIVRWFVGTKKKLESFSDDSSSLYSMRQTLLSDTDI